MRLYFLFRDREGEIAIAALTGPVDLKATNQGFGPYDAKPTDEMLQALRDSGFRLPTHSEMMKSFGLMPKAEFEALCKKVEQTTNEIIKSLMES